MRYNERIEGKDFLVIEIDASKCVTWNKFYKEFEQAFDLSYYSTNVKNHAAFIDNMTDLGWFKECNFKLIVKNLHKFRKNNTKIQEDFFCTMSTIEKGWKCKQEDIENPWENHFWVEYRDGK